MHVQFVHVSSGYQFKFFIMLVRVFLACKEAIFYHVRIVFFIMQRWYFFIMQGLYFLSCKDGIFYHARIVFLSCKDCIFYHAWIVYIREDSLLPKLIYSSFHLSFFKKYVGPKFMLLNRKKMYHLVIFWRIS